MVRGNHPTRVDEKGRLKIPAEFKRLIDERYNAEFYITSLDGKTAQIYPFEEWRRIEEKLARLSNFNPTKKKLLNRTNYYGQQVEMDGQGRLLMPQLLRESAQVKGEVAVTGNGVKIVGHLNMPSRIAVDASQLYARNLLAFLALIVDKEGQLRIDTSDEIVKSALLTLDGAVVNPALIAEPAVATADLAAGPGTTS